MKPLVIIPARGGSKGLPGKNIKRLSGKPLIHYAIETARTMFSDDKICITTDASDIKRCAEQTGLNIPFLRPKELASDYSSTYEVLLHAIEYYNSKGYEADTVILLQPTSPFRTAKHLKEALALFDLSVDMVVSVTRSKAHPSTLFRESEDGFINSIGNGDITRRQDLSALWQFNGAIYIINVGSLLKKKISEFEKVRKYEMDEISSHDIDTPLDWEIAKAISKIKRQKFTNEN